MHRLVLLKDLGKHSLLKVPLFVSEKNFSMSVFSGEILTCSVAVSPVLKAIGTVRIRWFSYVILSVLMTL